MKLPIRTKLFWRSESYHLGNYMKLCFCIQKMGSGTLLTPILSHCAHLLRSCGGLGGLRGLLGLLGLRGLRGLCGLHLNFEVSILPHAAILLISTT